MRRTLGSCVLCVCALPSACHPPPPPNPAPVVAPELPSQSRPAVTAEPDAALPGTTETPEEPAAAPPARAADPDEPVAAQFGLPLPRGHYTFPNGLRVRFTATHECEYDSTDPCSPFEVVAWFKGKEGKSNILPGKSKRVVGHSMQVTEDQELVVRK